MRSRRGLTLAEMAVVMSLTVVVLGAVAGLYGFTVSRLSHAVANTASINDAARAADKIEATIRNATSCTTYSSGGPQVALVCTMPASGTDIDGDGFLDVYAINSITKRGLALWGTGRRVWYYMADSTGLYGTPEQYLWRAQRSDGLVPLSSDIDQKFTNATSTRKRYPLISSFTFTDNAAQRTVDFTITASTLTRAERKPSGGGEGSQSYTHSETRRVFWRNGGP